MPPPDAPGDSPGSSDFPLYVQVAVPVPLAEALTYEVPEAFRCQAVPGVRARVRVGPRRLVGVILEVLATPPDGVRLRPLEEVLDRDPVLSAELLELARFVAEYYLAPIGEVVRSMLPSKLPPWGDRKVWLTSAGALAAARSSLEEAVVETLRDGGRRTLAELQKELGAEGLDEVVEEMLERGRLASGEGRRRSGVRYVAAVDLAPQAKESLLEACGRSAEGKEVVELLSGLARPATVEEITDEVGCGPGVVRRLVSRGVLRRFTQVERLSLDHHLLGMRRERPAITLRPDQQEALEATVEALRAGRFEGLLLGGVTGSGKTEVYLRAVEEALRLGRSSILLVPEIALVPALARTLQERFGRDLALLHSGLSGAERHQEWERLRRGDARVVLGPRSAIFAPVDDLGLLVVDEEQDGSYKQDHTPRYNGRDLALVRARAAGAVCLLVSATPSLESRLNVQRGKLTPLGLTTRAGQGELPEGILVDLRQEKATRRPGEVTLSTRLREELERALSAGDQVILLRNRRGYSPMLLCRACGEDLRCADCGLPRTYHRRDGALICHYCGSGMAAPRRCPSCSQEALEPIGAGTERVEENFSELYPGVSVDVLDRDAVRRRGGVAGVLERFRRGETQVLVGTQMVSKGHHFPRVALTAVLAADTYLGFPDFRAVERTYNLLTQLAGRAGRGQRPGRVVVQTFHPEHYAIQAALAHDDDAFLEEEMRFRRIFHYPPFTRMIQLLVRDERRERGEETAAAIARAVHRHPAGRGVRVSGPAPAPFERLRGKWRFQLLLRGPHAGPLKRLVREVLPERPHGEVVVDVDPYELL